MTNEQQQDRADYLQSHKDDVEEWGEPVHAPKRRRGRLGATVTVRFEPGDADLLRVVAERNHLTYSDVVRGAVRNFLHPSATLSLTTANLWISMQPPTGHQGGQSQITPAFQPQSWSGVLRTTPPA